MGIIYSILSIFLIQEVWIEKNHQDFADGWEYFYTDGDTAVQWDTTKLKRWEIGGIIYAPVNGGLKIIGRDWDLNDDDWLEVVLGRREYGRADIYWNSPMGFDTTRKTVLEGLNTYPQGFAIGDLNCDGYEDIIIAEYDNKVHIFHGSAGGYLSFADDSIVSGGNGLQQPLLGDINNDGYSDVIVSGQDKIYIYCGPGPFHSMAPDDSIIYSSSWLCRLFLCDLNYDRSLDISVSNGFGGLRVYWGPNYLSFINLNAGGNSDHSVADMNQDGYLDIFINQSGTYDLIYWGSSSGFNTSSYVPGNGGGDCSVEDVNSDGELDIVANQLSANAGYIIWGPSYNTFTSLPLSNFQMQVVNTADFDNNDEIDVLFGGAGGSAYLYWNDGGFSPANNFIFPDESDDAVWEDLGNLWDRSNKERYLSSVFDAGNTIAVDSVKWWGNFPIGVTCSVWVRGALDTTAWGRWVLLSNGATDTLLAGKRYLQYRCIFITDYKRTSVFSFDSIKFFYRSTGILEQLQTSNLSIPLLNTPNPFSQTTAIKYVLPMRMQVSLKIYNVAGRIIKNLVDGIYEAGSYSQVWNGEGIDNKKVNSGIYFYLFEAGDFKAIGKLIFIH